MALLLKRACPGSPLSPSVQVTCKRRADFSTPKAKNAQGQCFTRSAKSPSCSTPTGLNRVSSSCVTINNSFSVDEAPPTPRSRKQLFAEPVTQKEGGDGAKIAFGQNDVTTRSVGEITCTPSCATPFQSNLTADQRGVQPKCLGQLNLQDPRIGCCPLFKNDKPLTTDELLLYVLMRNTFPQDTFIRSHSIEKYSTVTDNMERVLGIDYSLYSVRNYFKRVRNNEVKGIGKIKGLCRWNYFKKETDMLLQGHEVTLQLLTEKAFVHDMSIVSLLKDLEDCCSAGLKPEINVDGGREDSPDKEFDIHFVHENFEDIIRPKLIKDWTCYMNQDDNCLNSYCFGTCPGYAEREIQLKDDGSWCLFIEGIKRETELSWTECPHKVDRIEEVVKVLNQMGKFSICQGCSYEKYRSLISTENEHGKPLFMTTDGSPAAFVETLLTRAKRKIIRSTKCLIFIVNDESLKNTEMCASCKSADHYLRTLKSRSNNSNKPADSSSSKKYDYMSKEELINVARKAAKQLKYLRLKVERLEEYRKKMTDIGPMSNTDLKHMFSKLYTGVEKRKEKLENPVCKWGNCKSKFENVEELYSHCKDHIKTLDTVNIAPVNREYACYWSGCSKNYKKLKLLQNHLREHTGCVQDEFLEVLLKDQAKALNTPSRQMRWHPKVIQWCLRIYCKSHSTYNEMQASGGLKLPSGRTLSDYKNFNSPKSGWHTETIQAMKDRFKKLEPPKHAHFGGLFFDEVKIKEGLVFDSSNWEIIDFTDFTNSDGESATDMLGTHILQFFFRSTFFKFDFPCSYFITKGATALQINRIFWLGVSLLHSYEFDIILACCDGASPNRTFITMNTNNPENSMGINYFTGKPIFYFSDPPHLMKKLRNNIYNSGSKEINKRYTRKMTNNGKIIIWDHIYAVYQREKKRSLFATALRSSHVHLDNLSKMRVKLAVQTLSSSVAQDMEVFENEATTSTREYLNNCEKFWNVFNDSKPIRLETDPRIQVLEGVLRYFREWKASLPGQYRTKSEQAKHFIAWQTMFDLEMTIDALKKLIHYIGTDNFIQEYGQLFLLINKVNQDFVESFFSCQRQMCGGTQNMTAYVYGYNINGFTTFQQTKGLVSSKQLNAYELEETLSFFDEETALPKRQARASVFDLVEWFVEI